MGCILALAKKIFSTKHPSPHLWSECPLKSNSRRAAEGEKISSSLCFIHNSNTYNIYNVRSDMKFGINSEEIPCWESGWALINENLIMQAGGADPLTNEESSHCFLINIGTRTISSISGLKEPRRRLRLIYHFNTDRVYAIGGVQEVLEGGIYMQKYTDNFFSYSFSTEEWEKLPDMVRGVEYPGCYIFNDVIYATGGATDSGTPFSNEIQYYSFADAEWELSEVVLPIPLYYHIAIPIDKAQILVIGGIGEEEPNHFVFLVSHDKYESISTIPLETPPIFPYFSLDSPSLIYIVNDQSSLLIYNRVTRNWETKDLT